jgi:deoxyribodipyrimidine photo-lyase
MDMENTRILNVKKSENDQKNVAYFMYRDQRVSDNHALLAAQEEALKRKGSLTVLFNLQNVAGRAKEHYEFMLEGLEETAGKLVSLNIKFVLTEGDSMDNILESLKTLHAGAVYFDFNPLRHSRSLVKSVADSYDGTVCVVDTHNVIPVWVASTKQETAAYTMRKKVHRNIEKYAVEPAEVKKHMYDSDDELTGMGFEAARKFVSAMTSTGMNVGTLPGEREAAKALRSFIEDDLADYAEKRNDITSDGQSGLSPYLHFGQISSLRVLLETMKKMDVRPLLFDEPSMAKSDSGTSIKAGGDALVEELVVRKELADNFCFYESHYDTLKGAPEWARKSLDDHRTDQRDFNYTFEDWKKAATHDPSWNAAQRQLLKTGKIHGYMRMYWAKKMLEWSKTPEEALRNCIRLNDGYSVDGGDPNGYANILWSIAGLHDRAWTERGVYGKIRYMNSAGLKRKFDLEAYLSMWR